MNLNVLFVILTVCIGYNVSLKFDPMNQKTGLTFVELSKARISYDTYTILYYVDIEQYKNITKTIEEFIAYANVECKKLTSDTCKIMLNQATVLMDHMKRDESDIEAYQLKNTQKSHSKKKRAIEFVGDIFHWAFGLMNADAARDYDQKIDNLYNDSSRLHKLLNEQTILIKETLLINNKTYSNLEKQLVKINREISIVKNFYTRFNWAQAELAVTESIAMIKMLESEHRRVTFQILRCLEDTVSGKITQLIPKERLINDLVQVSKYLKEEQKLPIDFILENPLHIFKYAKIVSALYGNRIMMEVNIPIVERGSYTIYEVIPIPTTINGTTIIIRPSTRYVLLNDNEKEFMPITPREYFKGKFNLQGERIIKPAENAIIDYSQNCEISIFMQPKAAILKEFCDIKSIPTSNYFVSINANDAYYVHIAKPTLVMEYCRHLPAQSHEIKESGILTIDKDCRIVTDKISLRPRNNYSYESKQIITLANHTTDITFKVISERVKRSNNISIPKLDENVLIQDSSIDFDTLIDRANKLIDKTEFDDKWNRMQYQSIQFSRKSYGFTAVVAIIIVALVIAVIWYSYRKFFSVDTWIKLADVLGRGNTDRVPPLFIRNI